MSSLAHICLGCDALFSTWKQLSAHCSRCPHYQELTDQIFKHKCKSSKRHTKDEKRAHPMSIVPLEGPRMHTSTFNQEEYEPDWPEVDVFDDRDHDITYPTTPYMVLTDIRTWTAWSRARAIVITSTGCFTAIRSSNLYAGPFCWLPPRKLYSPCPHALIISSTARLSTAGAWGTSAFFTIHLRSFVEQIWWQHAAKTLCHRAK